MPDTDTSIICDRLKQLPLHRLRKVLSAVRGPDNQNAQVVPFHKGDTKGLVLKPIEVVELHCVLKSVTTLLVRRAIYGPVADHYSYPSRPLVKTFRAHYKGQAYGDIAANITTALGEHYVRHVAEALQEINRYDLVLPEDKDLSFLMTTILTGLKGTTILSE